MIRSMTGFGKSSKKTPYGEITAEIKTLNHKSLSITCNPMNGFFLLEEKARKVLEKKICRGKVFVRITRENIPGQKSLQKIQVNEKIAREYVRKIKKAQKDIAVKGELEIRDLLSFPGVVETGTHHNEETKLWPHIREVLEKALDKLVDFRDKEGAQLARDFKSRLGKIRRNMRRIKKHEKKSVADFRKKLKDAIKDLEAEQMLDRERVENEVAAFAKNCDITEEVTRMEGHLDGYEDLLKSPEHDVGKKLDFIAQEMQREANTIGAKSSSFKISKSVIEVKSEIEKMREQIRNVE
ncbi:MAG: YicC family protein [Candidatus Omnitrophica bacterium]|nr:YicC family protein [Candidatus Omnitrophota bacterium]